MQVFRPAGEEWRLEASDGLAVLASHRALVMAALGDVKYDKIVHVRQVRMLALAYSLACAVEDADSGMCASVCLSAGPVIIMASTSRHAMCCERSV